MGKGSQTESLTGLPSARHPHGVGGAPACEPTAAARMPSRKAEERQSGNGKRSRPGFHRQRLLTRKARQREEVSPRAVPSLWRFQSWHANASLTCPAPSSRRRPKAFSPRCCPSWSPGQHRAAAARAERQRHRRTRLDDARRDQARDAGRAAVRQVRPVPDLGEADHADRRHLAARGAGRGGELVMVYNVGLTRTYYDQANQPKSSSTLRSGRWRWPSCSWRRPTGSSRI